MKDILDFWIGGTKSLWFTKSDATDEKIRTRFGGTIEAALRGELQEWTATLRACIRIEGGEPGVAVEEGSEMALHNG